MPGKRTDCEREWIKLDEVLTLHREVARALAIARDDPFKLCWILEEEMAVHNLKNSGRLSATQIRLIRKLAKAVILTERNADTP